MGYVRITKELSIVVDSIKDVGSECIATFFSKKCEVKEKWKVVNSLQGNFDYILALSAGNQLYQALLYLGLSEGVVKACTEEKDLPVEDIMDIFGELTNTYMGMLSDHTKFTDRFGILLQGIPVLYQNGKTTLPFITGVEGWFHIDNDSLYVGFAIRQT